MDKLKRFQLKFTTGHSKDVRYYYANAVDLNTAEDELMQMYCGGNTTFLGGKEVFDEYCSCDNGEPDYCAGHNKTYCSSCLKEMKE